MIIVVKDLKSLTRNSGVNINPVCLYTSFIKMSLAGGKKSVSERLDSLLIKILKSMEEYVMKKEEFLNIYRDVEIWSFHYE